MNQPANSTSLDKARSKLLPESLGSIIDLSAWVGNYPFRGIRNSGVDDFKRLMRRLRIERAVVSSFESIFWENGLDAYLKWASVLADEPLLETWPVVNPMQCRDLETVLDRCPSRGLRLLPNYHSYRLHDPCVERVMNLARERDMAVQVFTRIADERWHWMLKVPPVDTEALHYLCSRFPDQRVILSGVNDLRTVAAPLRQHLRVFADISRVRDTQFAFELLGDHVPLNKLVFGSLWPIQIIEATLWQVSVAAIDEDLKRTILKSNAAALTKGPVPDVDTALAEPPTVVVGSE